MIRPEPEREPLPPLKHCEPPRVGRSRIRRWRETDAADRDWFVADSPLEEAVQSELVSEVGFLAPGNYGAIPKRLWMITEAEEGYFGL
jgi:hypothetical protein